MRKLLTTIIALGVAGFVGNAFAVEGDFELSGHVNTGLGYTHFGSNASAVVVGPLGAANTSSAIAVSRGPLGDLGINTATLVTKGEQILGFVDEAELDATKSFGENVRTRADLAFGRALSGSRGALAVEQAYATVNIPVGNGAEFLVGRFDAPIGFESVERNNNSLFSYGAIFSYLRPHSGTGLKFYYPFSDMIDLHVYLVNNLRDALGADPALPSLGLRTGFSWGDEGKRSTIGVSIAGGPEALDAGNKKDDLSYLGDVDWHVWLGENFALGGEGIYRTDRRAVAAGVDARYFAGQLNLQYVFNDVWDGTLRVGWSQAKAGASSGLTGAAASLLNAGSAAKTQGYEASYGMQYHIADGAKVQFEGRYDLVKVTGAANGHVYGGVVGFLYNF